MEQFRDKVRSRPGTLIFSDGEDCRVINAVFRLKKDGLIKNAILVGNTDQIRENTANISENPDKIVIVDIKKASVSKRFREKYRTARNLSLLESLILDEAMKDPVVIGSVITALGEADGFIGGLRSGTTMILKNGIDVLKADRKMGIITSFCMLQTDNPDIGENGLLLIADPAINIDPSVGVLCKIAEAAARFFRETLRIKPRIAFLSYSTHGSAEGKSVDKMRVATERTREKAPELTIDGELEIDSAIFPEIALQKIPDSPLKGNANILIFPNIDSANISSNLIHFFGKAKLIGPILYGLNKPYNIISDISTESDIYNLALITQLQAKDTYIKVNL